MVQTHQIEGTDELLMSAIKDQASSLEHGWREAVQNGIDSPGSTRVELEYTAERTVVRDDGDGVDLSTEDGLALLKDLGETTKDRDDDSTIGQFGIGKGQIIAKGHAVFMSGRTALHFDVERWGLECKAVPLRQPVDGLEVRVAHYPDEVPSPGDSRWDQFDSRIERRFRYVEHVHGVEVAVNGDTVSDHDPFEKVSGNCHTETFESDHGDADIAVEVGTYGHVKVYSNGVFVTRDYDLGVTGVVVSHANMDVDFGRGGIKDGCPVWGAVRDRLSEVRMDLFEETSAQALGDDARRFIVDHMADDGDARRRFSDKKVLRTASETFVSLDDVYDRGTVGVAPTGSKAADRLNEVYDMMVLDEGDEAVQELEETGQIESVDRFDVQQKADEMGLVKVGETVPDDVLNTVQEKKLLAARELSTRLGIDRAVRYGESDMAAAWTDGSKLVVITDGAAPSRNRAAWIWELAETLVHERCHDEDTMQGCDHGRSYDRKYRREWRRAVDTVADFVTEVEREGLADVVEGVQVVRPNMEDHIEWKQ